MKTIKIFFITIICFVVVVAVAGFIKFNILGDDIYVQLEDGSVVKYNELPEE